MNGAIYGGCARKAYLRQQGISLGEHAQSNLIMFAGGKVNETVWDGWLDKAWPHKIKSEEEIPTVWQTEIGTNVTGRPDKVLMGENGKPLMLLELKMVSSIWTAYSVLFSNTPKFGHLAQSAHYMSELGTEGRLIYTNYVKYAVSGWLSARFPKQNEVLSEYCEFDVKGKAKAVLPFVVVYELSWDDKGMLQYRKEDTHSPWTSSVISRGGIEAFYAEVDGMEQSEKLPARPKNVKPTGKEEGWSLCDAKYCALAGICDKHTKKSTWMKAVREQYDSSKSEKA